MKKPNQVRRTNIKDPSASAQQKQTPSTKRKNEWALTSRSLFEANAARLKDAIQETESLLEAVAALLGEEPSPRVIKGMQKLVRRQMEHMSTCVNWFVATAAAAR